MTEEERLAAEAAAAAAKATKDAADAKAAKDAADAAALAGTKKGPTDEEARLLREVMQKKEKLDALTAEAAGLRTIADQLKELGGLDALKELVKKSKDSENKELEAKGQWDILKQRMADEHTRAMTLAETTKAETEARLNRALSEIDELTIGSAFSNSKFIAADTLLPATKARTLYGNYFDRIDGKLVGHDKPRGSSARAPIVDASGNPVDFDAAIARIVDADPDKEYLLRSKAKPGAGSGTRKSEPTGKKDELSSTDRIRSGLKGLNLMAGNM